VSGLIMGILLSRTISGFVADTFGWRSIYVAAAMVIVVLAIVLARVLPTEPPRPKVSYGALLRSVFAVVGKHRQVQITLVIGGTIFGVFSMFWTGLTFLLASPPFSYSVSQIGLVGLVGLAGAMAAQRAGWLHDRGWSVAGTGSALALAFVSLLTAGLGSTAIVPILIAVLLLDIAVQATNVLNQTRLLSVDPNARSRLNTAFVACNFVGGAIGSALTGVLWEYGGWTAVVGGAEAMVLFAIGVWFVFRMGLSIVLP
jgi:predicted MFS family arabinose efflux permease